jgi:hypothetical protein
MRAVHFSHAQVYNVMGGMMWRHSLLASLIIVSLAIAGLSSCTSASAPYIYVTEFQVTPNPIHEGENATLYWNVQGASEVEIDNGIGQVSPYGHIGIMPGHSTSYTLVASNPGRVINSIAKIEVIAIPPPPKYAKPNHPISALDTETLLKLVGQNVDVQGRVVFITETYRDNAKSEVWYLLIFDDKCISRFNDLANCPVFRAVIQESNSSDFSQFDTSVDRPDFSNPVEVPNLGWGPRYPLHREEVPLGALQGKEVIVSGVVNAAVITSGGRLRIPEIHLTSASQIKLKY